MEFFLVSKSELPRGCFLLGSDKRKEKVLVSLWHSLRKRRKGGFVLFLFGVERRGLIKTKKKNEKEGFDFGITREFPFVFLLCVFFFMVSSYFQVGP